MADTTVLGYIPPEGESAADRPLEDIFQEAIKGITGLPGNLVRPQAPEVIATIPEVSVTWISFRVVVTGHDFDAYIEHQPSLLVNGASELSRGESIDLIMSIYGPAGHQIANRWVNGLALDQNRWTLMDHGIKFRSQGNLANLPALLKEQWSRRLDLTTNFTRRLKVTYPVRTIGDATVGLNNERFITPIVVEPNP